MLRGKKSLFSPPPPSSTIPLSLSCSHSILSLFLQISALMVPERGRGFSMCPAPDRCSFGSVWLYGSAQAIKHPNDLLWSTPRASLMKAPLSFSSAVTAPSVSKAVAIWKNLRQCGRESVADGKDSDRLERSVFLYSVPVWKGKGFYFCSLHCCLPGWVCVCVWAGSGRSIVRVRTV